MKSCPDAERLAGWIEGSLAEDDRLVVRAHLAACDECRRAVGLAAVLEPPSPEAPDEALLERVISAVRPRPALRWAVAAAGVAAVLAISFWLARETPPEPTPAAPAPVALEPVPEPLPEPPEIREFPQVEEAVPPQKVAAPAPVPETAPEPRPPEPRPAEPKPESVAEAPRVEPPQALPEEKAPPERPAPGRTETDLSAVFGAVFMVDPTGDLWVRRDGKEPAKAGAYERLELKDMLCARNAPAGFTLEGRTSVVLEKGSEAAFCYFKPRGAYRLVLERGSVTIDTEGLAQSWQVARGTTELSFAGLDGRLSVEPRGEELAALLLEGRGEYGIGRQGAKAEVGREMVLARDGVASSRRVETRRRNARFEGQRPRVVTAFSVDFGVKEGLRPFAYQVTEGSVRVDAGLSCLRAQAYNPDPKQSVTMSSAIRPLPPMLCSSGMALRLRYRTSAADVKVTLGKFSNTLPTRSGPGRWVEAEIPLSAFENEGVMMVPYDEIPEIRFEGESARNAGFIDVTGIQFLRRSR